MANKKIKDVALISTSLAGTNTVPVSDGGITALTASLDQIISIHEDKPDPHAGVYAPVLVTDENYVTDAEKAALHSHSNKTALDNVSGTNTGDQDLSALLDETAHDALDHSGLTGIPSDLEDLNNVTITTPSDGQILSYNAGTWENATPSALDLQNTQTSITGTIIGTTPTVEQALSRLDESQEDEENSGFEEWTSGSDADTYTITGGTFQIDRAGYGFIRGKRIEWTAPQATGVLDANTAYFIYVDTDGVLKASASYLPGKIMLFEVLFDGVNYLVVRENHPYSFQSGVSGYLHRNVGNIISGAGALVARVAGGTGAATGDREIKIVGADTYEDHGLTTTIPDSGGAAVTWLIYYKNASGFWARHSSATELPMVWNNAGTPTPLTTTATGDVGLYTLYVTKHDIETITPKYIAVMNAASFNTEALANAAITAGTVSLVDNELATIELAQLGYAVVQNNVAGGYVAQAIVAKATLGKLLVGGQPGTNHALLSNLDYASSGHTGFQPAGTYATEAFKTIAVAGQSDVVADGASDTLTLAAGSNVTITTDASTDTITIAAAGGGTASDSFKTISVSGQSDVVAESSTDTLTLVAGSGMTITTDAGTDTITFVSGGLENPMTTAGDIIIGGASGAPTRLAKGTDGQVLTLASGNPSWAAAASGGGSLFVSEIVVTDSPVASIEFTGLDGNTDGDYYIVGRLNVSSASTVSLYSYINGDTTNSNYMSQVAQANATTFSASIESTARIGIFAQWSGVYSTLIAEYIHAGGVITTYSKCNYQGGELLHNVSVIQHSNVGFTNLTSIKLQIASGDISVGSSFQLYKRK
jgi:hypothetical protein